MALGLAPQATGRAALGLALRADVILVQPLPEAGHLRLEGVAVAGVVQHEVGLLDPLLPADLGPDACPASARSMWRCERRRSRAISVGQSTTTTRSSLTVWRCSAVRSGIARTTMWSVPSNASRSSIMATPMAGWVRAFRSAREASSTKATLARAGTVDGAVGCQYPLAETVDQGLVGRATGRHHVAGHLVGVDEDGPAVDQEIGHGRLSRPDAPGKADRQHRRMVAAPRRP